MCDLSYSEHNGLTNDLRRNCNSDFLASKNQANSAVGNIRLELQKASRNEPVDCQMWESWRHSRMRTSGRLCQELKLSGFNQTVLQEVKITGGYKNTKLEPPLDDCVMVFLCFTI